MTEWGKPAGETKDDTCVRHHFKEGVLEIREYGPTTIRLTWIVEGAKARTSRAAVAEPAPAHGALRVKVDGDSGAIRVEGRTGTILKTRGCIAGGTRNGKDNGIKLAIELGAGESAYGLGEKTGFLDKRGRRYQMWNTDEPLHTPDKDPLYQSIPFMIRFDGKRSSGLFLDSTARSFFDVGFTDPDTLTVETRESVFDLYVFEGDETGPASVTREYARLTGTMKLPPLWALGYQQCRWSYWPESKIMEIANGFRARDIPCDVIYFDIDYMDSYRVFTWDRDRFPEPKAMTDRLHEMGFRLVTIVDPGVKKDSSYRVYVDGCKKGVFCKLPTGEVYHGEVWPGPAAYPDFSSAKTRSWWASLHTTLFGAGIDGIWNDMNEPSDFSPDNHGDRTLATVPEEVMMDEDGEPRPFSEGHNAYGFDMCRATAEAYETLKPGERPFVLTRSGYAGIQRHAAVWTGDNHSWWEHLASSMPMLLNLSLSGVPFCGGDAGGFQGEASGELFARWIQYAIFTPFLRAHSVINSKPHEPWAFGPETERIVRDAIRLRYRLMPYLYGEMYRASISGMPVIRPMVYAYPDDPETRTMCDQFMFGPSMLVAPVSQPGKTERLVYLPEGIWYDWRTNEKIDGGRTIIASAPPDSIPVYVRAGAVIPVVEPAAHTGALDFTRVTIKAWSGASGSFEWYEDDGRTTGYLDGKYNLTRISIDGATSKLSFQQLHRGWDGGCPDPKIEIM
jgi:alpha-glucosidase